MSRTLSQSFARPVDDPIRSHLRWIMPIIGSVVFFTMTSACNRVEAGNDSEIAGPASATPMSFEWPEDPAHPTLTLEVESEAGGDTNKARGTIRIELLPELAPATVAHVMDLAKDGYYDGLNFHRVIPDFVIQGGCPDGNGAGGPGYNIDCELDGDNQYHDKGVLSMAHAGRNTGGSQFFVCHSRNNTSHLDRNHTCFGKVVEGVEVIDEIRQGDEIEKIVVTEE
jgi:peptidyl-prolyl cis-trans isomerase B (cyclophilin B)